VTTEDSPPKKNREKNCSAPERLNSDACKAVAHGARKPGPKKNFEKIVPRGNDAAVVPALAGAAQLLQTRAAYDPEFFRRAIKEMRQGGPAAAIVADVLEARLAVRRSERLARMGAALAEASTFYAGSVPEIARQLAAELRRYEQNDWRRKDHRLAAYPPSPVRTLKACLFDALRHGGDKSARGEKQIGNILKGCSADIITGNSTPIAISASKRETSNHKPHRSREKMNSPAPKSAFIDALKASSIGVQIEAEARAAIVAKRRKLVDALAANEAKADKEFPALAKAVDAAVLKVRAAEKALREANDDLSRAGYAKSAASVKANRARFRSSSPIIPSILMAIRSKQADGTSAESVKTPYPHYSAMTPARSRTSSGGPKMSESSARACSVISSS